MKKIVGNSSDYYIYDNIMTRCGNNKKVILLLKKGKGKDR
jgi:hypothetical protein